MRQLVELGKNKDKFTDTGTNVIAVFREEAKGEEGLKMIKEKTETPFSLALDNGNKKTGRYSSGKGEFTGYVIDGEQMITKIIKGNLRTRAKSAELLEAVAAAGGEAGSETKDGSESKAGSASKEKGSASKGGSKTKSGSGSK